MRAPAGHRARPPRCTSSTTAWTPTSPGCWTAATAAAPAAAGTLRVLGVGRLVAKKGFDVLVEACADPARPRRRLRAAHRRPGRQGLATRVRERIAALGLDDRVALPARWARPSCWTSTAARTRCACPAGCSPDDRDGIPNVLVEAMAAGTPVVATAVSGIPELVRDGDNGLLVRARRPAGARRRAARACTTTRRSPPGSRAAGPRDGRASASTASGSRAGSPTSSRRPIARVTGVATPPSAPVLCLIEHEHRDLAVAEAVRAGRFTSRASRASSAPSPTGCGGELPADEEWRIEWVKFYYGLDLARVPDDRRAALPRRAGSVWSARSSRRPRRRRPEPRSPPGGCTTGSTRGRASPRRRRSPSRLDDSLAQQAAHVRANLTPRAQPPHAGALRAVARRRWRCPELDAASTRRSRSRSWTATCATDFRPDGVHREASTHYHLIALRSFVGARENARRHGLALPPATTSGSRRLRRSRVHCQRPDGTIPALSDADTGDYGELLRLAGAPAPQRTDVSFPRRRLPRPAQRLGRGARYADLRLRAARRRRPRPLRPAQLRGRGRRPRRSSSTPAAAPTPRATPNRRRWFRGTAAHNTVTVDGVDQTPYRRGRPRRRPARGPACSAASARPASTCSRAEARSPRYDAVHRRRLAFVAESLLARRGPADAAPRRTATTCASTSRPRRTARRAGASGIVLAPGVAIAVAGAARSRSRTAGSPRATE